MELVAFKLGMDLMRISILRHFACVVAIDFLNRVVSHRGLLIGEFGPQNASFVFDYLTDLFDCVG